MLKHAQLKCIGFSANQPLTVYVHIYTRTLTCVDDAFPSEIVDVDGEIVVEIFARFFTGEPVAADDRSRVDLLFDQLLGVLQQLRGDDDDRGGSIADFLILGEGGEGVRFHMTVDGNPKSYAIDKHPNL